MSTITRSGPGHTTPAAASPPSNPGQRPVHHGGLIMEQPNSKVSKKQKQDREPNAQNKGKNGPENVKNDPQAR